MCNTLLKLRNKLDKIEETENIRFEYAEMNNPTSFVAVGKKNKITKRGKPITTGSRFIRIFIKNTLRLK